MLSMHRPLPSMLIVMPWAFSTPVKSVLVNWLPWSVLKISGLPNRAQRLFQRLDAEVGVQRVRHPPGQHPPASASP